MFVLILNFDNMNLKITGHFNVSKLVVSMNNRSFFFGPCRIKTHYLKKPDEGFPY